MHPAFDKKHLPMTVDPDYFSWHDYERTWKSDAVWVDLRPVREAVDRIAKLRPGRNEKARAYDAVGECAAAILLGGRVQTENPRGPDLKLASGDEYEVCTSFWGGSAKWQPAMTTAKRGNKPSLQTKLPTIWCVTKRYPECFDGAWVCGVIDAGTFVETRISGGGKWKWAWMNKWVDGRFRNIFEVMQDELARPHLRPGMTYRRSADDIGIAEYLEDYGFLRPTQASANTPQASSSQTAGSGVAIIQSSGTPN